MQISLSLYVFKVKQQDKNNIFIRGMKIHIFCVVVIGIMVWKYLNHLSCGYVQDGPFETQDASNVLTPDMYNVNIKWDKSINFLRLLLHTKLQKESNLPQFSYVGEKRPSEWKRTFRESQE